MCGFRAGYLWSLGQEMAYHTTKVPRSWKPEGAFYVLPRVKDPEHMMSALFNKYKVITYLVSWFGSPKRIRLSYALDKEKLYSIFGGSH